MPDEYDKLMGKLKGLYKKNNIPAAPKYTNIIIQDVSDLDYHVDEWSYIGNKEEAPDIPNQVFTLEQAENLKDGSLLVDADGYAFQKRNGQWFMAGAQYSSMEFSGKFPAQIALLKD